MFVVVVVLLLLPPVFVVRVESASALGDGATSSVVSRRHENDAIDDNGRRQSSSMGLTTTMARAVTNTFVDVVRYHPTSLWSDRRATGEKVASTGDDKLGDADIGIARPMTTKSMVDAMGGRISRVITKITGETSTSFARWQKLPTPPRTDNYGKRMSSEIKTPRTRGMIEEGELKVIDARKIAEEGRIDVELIYKQRPLDLAARAVKIDRETYQKVGVYQPPDFLMYLPSSVQPLVSGQFRSYRKVLSTIPNEQLFVASVIAGSVTEIVRAALLYPLSTIKSRVQARKRRKSSTINHRRRKRGLRKRWLRNKLRVTWLTFLHEAKRGDLYDGLLPTLLVSVPSSGVYSGAKEVSKRVFSMAVVSIQASSFHNHLLPAPSLSSHIGTLAVNLLAAFVADIAALAIRTPADVLSLRLQVFGKTNVRSDFGNWAMDSVALLPAMIVTDTPLLLSRIFLNAAITTSGENLGRYEFETIVIACLCAFLTTPFDVARTRILLPTLPSEEEEEEEMVESGATRNQSRDIRRRRLLLVASSDNREQRRERLSVLVTMKRIAAEGDGGVQNLFAGWFERTAFLGVGRAWFDPLRVIGYLGIRDAVLLKLFD
ncbi:hypothetical protein ACHAXA_001512 [Cyclostephanos tholiformis]|uniref:Mitochondrial carrier n=1 Tax=Cyclostephanos tholiformis TaxID=382380 RepID=A0ABD3RX23_9STRA